MRTFVALILTCFLVANAHANGKKTAPISITFHTEATDLQSKKFSFEIQTPKGKRFISKSPFIVTSNILAYKTFPSPHDPKTLGATFQLNRAGAHRLHTTSGQYSGKWIMCSINGKVVDMLYIDRQVDGRLITVWRGIEPEMAQACNSIIPQIGESKKEWKARLKAEKKRAKLAKKGKR